MPKDFSLYQKASAHIYLQSPAPVRKSKCQELPDRWSRILISHHEDGRKLAYIAGGETVVHLKGTGKGGRNQEIALSAAIGLSGVPNAAVFSLGSDGTDGPTDAAGGYADGETVTDLKNKSIDIHSYLDNNDAYNALKAVDGLRVEFYSRQLKR